MNREGVGGTTIAIMLIAGKPSNSLHPSGFFQSCNYRLHHAVQHAVLPGDHNLSQSCTGTR